MLIERIALTTGLCLLMATVVWGKDNPAAPDEKPESGLALKLKIKPAELKRSAAVELSCSVRNLTGKTIQIPSWGIMDISQVLEVSDIDGKTMPVGGGRNHTKRLPADAFGMLKNGETKTFKLEASFADSGRLTVNELGGGVWTWELPAGKYHVKALFNVSDTPAIRASFPAANKEPIWIGAAQSPSVTITVGQ